MANVFTKIIKWSIYLLVFLLPVFWLPFSLEQFEFNKQYLLFFLVSLGCFAWLARMVLVDKEIRFKKTPLDIFVAVFLFVAILSAIFSVDKGSSIFGFYGRFSDGLIGLINFALLYFLITNNVGMPSGLVKTLMWSAFFVILMAYMAIFRYSDISIFRNINAGGLTVFLAVIVVLLVGKILLGEKKEKMGLIINYLLLLASLFLLLVIDFTPAWIILLISLAFFVAFSLWQRTFKEMAGKLVLPILLMVIAGLFMFVNIKTLIPADLFADLRGLPQERVLNQGESWGVGLRTAIGGVKNGFLGTGMGTFSYDFAKFKSLKFNNSELWQIRFDRPGNHISEILGTTGFLGLISYIALIGMFLLISWILINTDKKRIPLLMALVALVVGQFVYYQNTSLAFVFWLILAISVVSWETHSTSSGQGPLKEITFSLQKFPEMSLIATVLLIVIGLGILATYYFGQQFYRADVIYAKSQKMALGKDRTALIEKAVKMNPNSAQYRAILARAYLNEALTEMRKPVGEQDSLTLQATVAKAIDAARTGTIKGPGQVATWETLGMIYRDIRLVASGAVEWGIKSFEKAITLEPTNPVLYTELGKLLSINEPEKAKEKFAKAAELKPDYLDALIQSALIYEREDNLVEAIKKMEDLSLEYPFNIEVLFQLGRLYFNADRIDESISRLEKVVSFMPNHSNAYYSLGIAYKEKKEKQKAIAAFEKVLELNPSNQDVIDKLAELKK